MAIVVSCPSCGAQYNVKDELAGRKAVCKKCNSQMQIPAQPAAASESLATRKPDEKTAAAGGDGQPTPSNCPMCGTGVLPGADSCMVCGHSFGGGSADEGVSDEAPGWAATAGGEDEDHGYESPEDAEERRVAELLAPVQESLARRITNWSVKIVLVLITVGVIGYAGWSIKQLISRVSSHGRIDALVQSGLDPKAELPELAKTLVDEIPHVATYSEDLAAQADSARERNLDVTGLQYVELEPYAKYHVVYKRKPFDPTSKRADEIPEAWRKAAVLATMLAHLPKDCDIDPLVEVKDPIALPPVKQLFLDRKDLDWQINASCDEDEQKRDFAAGLLIEQLKTSSNDEQPTRQTLAKKTTLPEKRKMFTDLQAKLGKREIAQPQRRTQTAHITDAVLPHLPAVVRGPHPTSVVFTQRA